MANAVWDSTDAVMLSGETAIGRYPVAAVAMMDRIVRAAEAVPDNLAGELAPREGDDSLLIALAAKRIVESNPRVRAVVCFTQSGYTARLLSKVRPRTTVLGVSPDAAVCRRLALSRAVVPVQVPAVADTDAMLAAVDDVVMHAGIVEKGAEVIVAGSMPVEASGVTNFLKLHRLGEA